MRFYYVFPPEAFNAAQFAIRWQWNDVVLVSSDYKWSAKYRSDYKIQFLSDRSLDWAAYWYILYVIAAHHRKRYDDVQKPWNVTDGPFFRVLVVFEIIQFFNQNGKHRWFITMWLNA